MEQTRRLGLSLSYDIITKNSGTVKGETKEAKLAKFIVQLPISTNYVGDER